MIFLKFKIVAERNYHIFYQMCSSAFPEMQSNYLLDWFELLIICFDL